MHFLLFLGFLIIRFKLSPDEIAAGHLGPL